MARRRFGSFELDAAARTLRQHGVPVKLHEQPLELLIALTERAGDVVTREELRRRLWPADTFVDYDNSLNNALSRLRDCLADDAVSPRFIETVPKRGYRFVAEVHANDGGSIGAVGSRTRVAVQTVGVAFVLVAVIAAIWLYARSPAELPAPRRLLVLPFKNLTGDPGLDYVVDGLTDDLITHVGRLSPHRLGVIARTTAATYSGTTLPLSQIASEVGVDHVIEGAVHRKHDRWHVTIGLTRASDASQIWAEMFDGPDEGIASLFDRITKQTVGGIAAMLGEDQVLRARAATLSTDAFDAWLRGRHEWNRFTPEGFTASIEWHRRALAIDPQFAQAASGLARAWVFLGLFEPSGAVGAYAAARNVVELAVRLDADSADALAMRGMVRLFHDFDRDGATRDLDAAIARAPNDALLLHWAAAAASARADHARSIALARMARSLDPKSVSVNADLGWYLYYARRFDEGLRQCNDAAKLDVSARGPALCRDMVLRAQRRLAVPQSPPTANDRSALYRAAADYAALGDRDAALIAIRAGVTTRASWAPFIAVDPAFDAVRADERFLAVLQETNFRDNTATRQEP